MRAVSCDNCDHENIGQITWNALATNMQHDTYCQYHSRTYTAVQTNPYDSKDKRSAQLDKDGSVM